MISVELKNGEKIELEAPVCGYELAETISEGLARAACAADINGEVKDLREFVEDGDRVSILTFDSEGGRHAFRHTASHILAQAIKRLYPEAMLAIGPAISDGFYYDIDLDHRITEDDLEAIEHEMKKIVKEKLPIERYTLPRNEAIAFMREAGEPYKVELIEDLPDDEPISFYRQGTFTDLCAGPHLMTTGGVKAVKLLQVSGAYWRGSEKNKMLQRIYGTCFPNKKQLKDHLERLEEAKKRDHNKLGRELGYFTTVDYIGQGLPILLPKGAKVIQILSRMVEDEEERRGYQITKTPYMAKADLYRISGHLTHYRDSMFILGDPDDPESECFALRPMTCPFQFQAYLTETRSYRDLPIRYNETSTLFRNESSGEMHGLIRVRQFTISEGHLIVRPDQLEEEIIGTLDLANDMLRILGLNDDVSYRVSLWDPENSEKFIGEAEQWEQAQKAITDILDKQSIPYAIGVGEAAFYGPKIDIQIKNVFGKEDTLITIQVDFQLAEQFGMYYTDRDGSRKLPTIIHRTSVGCYERTLALLIEKYAGAMPLWLAPEQIRILAIGERHQDFARALKARLREEGLRAEFDLRDEKIGKKIRDAQLEKVPYMLVIGDREMESGELSVRHRTQGDLGAMTEQRLLEKIKDEVDRKALDV